MKYLEILKIPPIPKLNAAAMKQARFHWDRIAKPLRGLGTLEEMVIRIAGITGSPDVILEKKAVIVMCADNGIVEEGISQADAFVTAVVSKNIAEGTASICRMAEKAGSDVLAVDIGIANEIESELLFHKKVSYGTKNFLKEPAMSEEECIRAIQIGIDFVRQCKEKGYQILATGEMGIGNTTTSSAMASILLEVSSDLVTGRGAGLDNKGYERKKQVISEVQNKYHLKKENPLECLRTVGGLDIAGLTGVFIGGAIYQIPVVIDGLISAVAALTAVLIVPEVRDILIASHLGKEPAMELIMKELELNPVIHANLALGEGTGAVLLFPMLDMALNVYHENPSFEELTMEAYQDYGSKSECFT